MKITSKVGQQGWHSSVKCHSQSHNQPSGFGPRRQGAPRADNFISNILQFKFWTVPVLAGLALAACHAPSEPPPVKLAPASTSPPPQLRPPPATPLTLREGFPQRYTVAPNDTVWAISERYLADPWRWRELWARGARDPEALYPGDGLEVYYDGETPQLRRVDGELPVIKLSPQVRIEYTGRPVPLIAQETIKPFIDHSVVFSEADWKGSPYVIGSADGRNQMVMDTTIYARGADFDSNRYRVFRPIGVLRDLDTGEFLGYSMSYAAEARLEEDGDPARLLLTDSRLAVEEGDRLLPRAETEQESFDFAPRPAPPDSYGRVVQIPNQSIATGRYGSIIVSLGDLDGMTPGTVLQVFKNDEPVKDAIAGKVVIAPGERAGLVVLYRIYDYVSYGLVTESVRPISVGAQVREPL